MSWYNSDVGRISSVECDTLSVKCTSSLMNAHTKSGGCQHEGARPLGSKQDVAHDKTNMSATVCEEQLQCVDVERRKYMHIR